MHAPNRHTIWVTIFLALLFLLAANGIAGAAEDVPPPADELPLPAVQFYAALAGVFTPLVGYLINTYAPWVTEPMKMAVQVGLAAVGGAAVQLLDAGDLAFDVETFEVLGTAVLSAVGAHFGLWRSSGVSHALGGGQNRKGWRGRTSRRS